MSAINPASFASPALGFQAPSGVGIGVAPAGPGTAGVGRGASTERRQTAQQQSQTTFSTAGQAGRGSQPPFAGTFTPDRAVIPGSAYPVAGYPYNAYGAFGASAARPGALPYAPGTMQNLDAYAGTFPQGTDYPAGGARVFSAPQASGAQHEPAAPALGPQADWLAGSFQGLSLNSR
jgi:hypothetical protein